MRFGLRAILLQEESLNVFYYKEYRFRPDYLPERPTWDYYYGELSPDSLHDGEDVDHSPRTLRGKPLSELIESR